MASLFREGIGISTDLKAAAYYVKQSGDQGHRFAQRCCGKTSIKQHTVADRSIRGNICFETAIVPKQVTCF
jgi:hypothetical protein